MPGVPQLQPPQNRRYRWYGLVPFPQTSFASGAFPGQENIPQDGAEDIVNAFIQPDGSLVGRGGVSLVSSPTTSSRLQGTVWDGYLAGGQKTIVADALAAPTSGLWGPWLVSPGNSPAPYNPITYSLAPFTTTARVMQPVEVAGIAFLGWTAPVSATVMWMTAGSPDFSGFSQAVTVTQNSPVVTTASTSALSPGMFMSASGLVGVAVIQTIDSATQFTLTFDWLGASSSPTATFTKALGYDYSAYQPQMKQTSALPVDALGTAASRLYMAQANRVFFSNRRLPLTHTKNDYHELPLGSRILGLRGLGDRMLVFTTAGAWVIGNAALDLTDSAGNAQQTLRQVDPEFVLWDHHGIATWAGKLIVPGTADVALMDGVSAPQAITGGVRDLYRSYVRAGYYTGSATTHQGHYFLPVITSASVVIDVLVCKLDTGAWTRLGGQAAGAAFASRAGSSLSARQPFLTVVGGANVLSGAAMFTPTAANKLDQSGSAPVVQVTTRTFTFGSMVAQTWKKLRVRFEMDDAATDNPTITAELATGRPGDSFTSLTGSAPEGETIFPWVFAKKARNIRFRLTSVGPSAKLVIRGIEAFARQSGHQ